MSCFDVIEFKGGGFTVSTETTSGCMNSGEREMEKLRSWRQALEPAMKKVFRAVEDELASMAGLPDGPALLAPPADPLETVWEEGMDALDVPGHLEKGNGPCLYRMRLRPRGPVTTVDIRLALRTLPSLEVRDAWKASLQRAIERGVR